MDLGGGVVCDGSADILCEGKQGWGEQRRATYLGYRGAEDMSCERQVQEGWGGLRQFVGVMRERNTVEGLPR